MKLALAITLLTLCTLTSAMENIVIHYITLSHQMLDTNKTCAVPYINLSERGKRITNNGLTPLECNYSFFSATNDLLSLYTKLKAAKASSDLIKSQLKELLHSCSFQKAICPVYPFNWQVHLDIALKRANLLKEVLSNFEVPEVQDALDEKIKFHEKVANIDKGIY